ncbi:MAG: 6-phosphofructokinase [Gammaproteobacteria bacterium]|nr:6-phosphofructokinase [Gammaproteobacteria bacterium]
MASRNALYAQSGGVTAVINATAAAVIETARAHRDVIGKLYAGRNGILGALREELFDTNKETRTAIAALRHTPGGAFGSCRYKLKGIEESRAQYQRLIEVFRAHDIGYFFYNGGNDSADTALKVSSIGRELGYPLACIGIPKTVDNDLAVTDCSPGFGSVAKYVAVSTREAAMDVVSMAETSTRVFILEVMGRHAGWIAAAAGLAGEGRDEAPHLILFPEKTFDKADFLERVKACVQRNGYCVVVASEGVRDAKGHFLSEGGTRDAFGHAQLGGLAPRLANMVTGKLGYKHHWAVADYLQRSARHLASQTDLEHAGAVGRVAVELAVAGENAVMPVIERLSDRPYRWRVGKAPLSRIANHEKKLPKSFMRSDGYGITAAARRYLLPLVGGEAWPPFQDGLPRYANLKLELAPQKLPPWKNG